MAGDADFTRLDTLIGEILNQTYKIEEKIGKGGMGVVFRARHLGIGDDVAIKVISPHLTENSESLGRFRREAQAARKLSHPNAVIVHDFNISEDGLIFLVMEYVKGETVEKYLQKHAPLTPQRALEILRPVAAALDVAHSLGIIHRDLKPANLMLCQDSSGQEQVKVLDFGTVQYSVENDQIEITQEGQIFGTPIYMAPEQVVGEPVSPATDIYALGVILYRMLAGSVPFAAATGFQTMTAHVQQIPELPSQRNSRLATEFDAVVMKALEKEADKRYRSASQLIERLALEIDLSTTSSRSQSLSRNMERLARLRQAATPNFNAHVGRDNELLRLQSEYRNALAGHARPLFIIGSPGIGKTQLTMRFREWVSQQGALVLSGKFFDYGGSVTEPLRLFKNMLAGALENNQEQDSVSNAEEKLKRFAGLEAQDKEKDGQDKWLAFDLLANVVTRLARARPLVLILDDLQWADFLSLEFIGYLLRNVERLPFAFVGTARAEEANSRQHPLNEWLVMQTRYFYYEKIELTDFDLPMIQRLLKAIFHYIEIGQNDLARLHQITGGNPLYLMEVVRMLHDSQKIIFRDGIWSVTSLEEIKLPDTISNVVGYKLKGCSEELRELLTEAAVIGDDFPFELLAAVSGIDEAKLEKLLAGAVNGFLLYEESNALGDDFRFYHTTIRRVIYDEIPKRQRRRRHLKTANAIEQVYRGKITRVLGTLAYHYYAANEWPQAVDYGIKALDQGCEQESWGDVAKYAQWVEEAAQALTEGTRPDPVDPAILSSVLLKHATALLRLGKLERAEDLAQQALRLAASAQSDLLSARSKVILCELGWFRGRFAETRRLTEEGLLAAIAARDKLAERYIHFHAGMVTWRSVSCQEALIHFNRAYELSRDSADMKLMPMALAFVGVVSHFKGEWRAGRKRVDEGLALARRLGERFIECRIFGMKTMMAFHERKHDEVIAMHDEGVALAREIGWRIGEIHMHSILGLSYMWPTNFDLEKAADYLQRTLVICEETGEKGFQVVALMGMARIDMHMGEYDKALARMKQILVVSEQTGDLMHSIFVLHLIGENLERASKIDEALNYFQQCEKMSINTDFATWELLALEGYARCLEKLGRREEAIEKLQTACALAEKLRNEFENEAEAVNFVAEITPLLEKLAQLRN